MKKWDRTFFKTISFFLIIAILGIGLCVTLDGCDNNNGTGPARHNIHSRFEPVDSVVDSLGK